MDNPDDPFLAPRKTRHTLHRWLLYVTLGGFYIFFIQAWLHPTFLAMTLHFVAINFITDILILWIEKPPKAK